MVFTAKSFVRTSGVNSVKFPNATTPVAFTMPSILSSDSIRQSMSTRIDSGFVRSLAALGYQLVELARLIPGSTRWP